jgi:hypothetical protein
MIISIEELIDAIKSAERRFCKPLVFVIPVSEQLLAQSSMSEDEIQQSIQSVIEHRLKECLFS